MKVRIKFTKHGAMKFIGHLDIMRYFQKAMRRADIPVRYSEGFSPHQIMSFAAPLGVGLTSNGEYMDIETEDNADLYTMKEQLNNVMAEGITVISCRKLDGASKNAMSIVAGADYKLQFREQYLPENIDLFASDLRDFYGQEQILITKKTKKSEKEIDIKPMIFDLHMTGNEIFMKLSTGSANNLKPELVMDAFYHFIRKERPEFAFQIQREEIYANIGTEDEFALVPLEAMGDDVG